MAIDGITHLGIIPRYNKHIQEDHIRGVYNGASVELGEFKLLYERDSDDLRRTKTMFKGIILVIKLDKDFPGQVVIKPSQIITSKYFTLPKNLKKINLEHSDFAKQFDIFATSEMYVRLLLTNELLGSILKIRDLFGRKIRFSFQGNQVVMLVSSTKNWFEPRSIFKTANYINDINTILSEINLIFNIINILQLNKAGENDLNHQQIFIRINDQGNA